MSQVISCDCYSYEFQNTIWDNELWDTNINLWPNEYLHEMNRLRLTSTNNENGYLEEATECAVVSWRTRDLRQCIMRCKPKNDQMKTYIRYLNWGKPQLTMRPAIWKKELDVPSWFDITTQCRDLTFRRNFVWVRVSTGRFECQQIDSWTRNSIRLTHNIYMILIMITYM